MPQCPRAARHSFCADSTRNFVVTCRHCDAVRDCLKSKNTHKYLLYRRAKRRELGLLTVAAPLDAPSSEGLRRIADECGLRNDGSSAGEGLAGDFGASGAPHVTLVEGLRPDAFGEGLGGAMEELRDALRNEPQLTVVRVHAVPRGKDRASTLVVVDVAVGRGASNTAESICAPPSSEEESCVAPRRQRLAKKQSWCALPQFPYHVAVGTCSRKEKSAVLSAVSKRFMRLQLRVDAEHMKALAPTDSEKTAALARQKSPIPIISDDSIMDIEKGKDLKVLETILVDKAASMAEEEETRSTDSTLPLESPDDSDEEDLGIPVDLSFLDDAIPSPAIARPTQKSTTTMSRVSDATAANPGESRLASNKDPLMTSFPSLMGGRLKQAPTTTKKQGLKRCPKSQSPRTVLPPLAPPRFGSGLRQVAPYTPGDSGASATAGSMQPRVALAPPQPPQTSTTLQKLKAMYNPMQPLFFNNKFQSQPLATYDQHPVCNTQQLYELYGQPVSPSPYPVEGGYITWVRVTPSTFEPLFVPIPGQEERDVAQKE